MAFFFLTVLFMYLGRKLGWALSRRVLYRASTVFAVIAAIAWGEVVAVSVFGLIDWQRPGTVLKWVMGYALGAYVAIPNSGLVIDASIPPESRSRHIIVSNLPVAVYTASLVLPALFGVGA